MIQRFSKDSLALLVALSVMGCAPPDNGIEEVAYPWAAKIEKSSAFAEIILPLSKQSISNHEMDKIKGLISQTRSGEPIYIRFLLAKPLTIERESLAKTQLAQLRKQLLLLGIAERNIEVVFVDAQENGHYLRDKSIIVMVSVEQYKAHAPQCGMWGPMPEAGPGGDKNFGCSTASNLVQMIANPKDLTEGQALGPADGSRNALAIKNYQTDKVKELKIEKVDIGAD